MENIAEENNSMAGQLDVWKLLDDAHHFVVRLFFSHNCIMDNISSIVAIPFLASTF